MRSTASNIAEVDALDRCDEETAGENSVFVWTLSEFEVHFLRCLIDFSRNQNSNQFLWFSHELILPFPLNPSPLTLFLQMSNGNTQITPEVDLSNSIGLPLASDERSSFCILHKLGTSR